MVHRKEKILFPSLYLHLTSTHDIPPNFRYDIPISSKLFLSYSLPPVWSPVGLPCQVPVYGFNCTKGWDPATGVGTPKFGGMLAAAMALP